MINYNNKTQTTIEQLYGVCLCVCVQAQGQKTKAALWDAIFSVILDSPVRFLSKKMWARNF